MTGAAPKLPPQPLQFAPGSVEFAAQERERAERDAAAVAVVPELVEIEHGIFVSGLEKP